MNTCFRNQSVRAAKAVAHRSDFFFRLRAELDRNPDAALIVDRESGTILSINLPAFELLAIDAVGFQVLDFGINQSTYERIAQQLQQTGTASQTILLHNADGDLIECEADAEVVPYYSGWIVLCFDANQSPPYRRLPKF
ncbi:MAG: hypothetical protein HC895_21085 [Leptolyngbyaceae cyanobacterium SM1_3_5]|nr:hypothetical protein [Leptolyngbyaceae cyanobacterium SM1_3_5]